MRIFSRTYTRIHSHTQYYKYLIGMFGGGFQLESENKSDYIKKIKLNRSSRRCCLMFSNVLHIGGESVNGIGLVVDHPDAAVRLVQRVSSNDIVSVVLLPGRLVVSGAVVLHSVLVGVGDVTLLGRMVLRGGRMVMVMVHVDVLLKGRQAADELLGEQDFLDREEGSGHAEQAQDKGDL